MTNEIIKKVNRKNIEKEKKTGYEGMNELLLVGTPTDNSQLIKANKKSVKTNQNKTKETQAIIHT